MHRTKNKTHIHLHTERTQFAHTQHREQNKRQNNMQHREQDTEHTEQNTENNTEQDNAQHSTQNSTHNYRTYSFDLYHEQIYIKDSNTIELYTISK